MKQSPAENAQGEKQLQTPEHPLEAEAEADNPDNPFNWSDAKKWSVTLIGCYGTFIVGFNATALTAAVSQTNDTFNISDDGFPRFVWPGTAWNSGGATAPMVVLPILDDYCTRTGYLITCMIILVFVIPQAVTQNFAIFFVCRLFAGCCGAVLHNAMDSTIAVALAKATQHCLPVSCYVFALAGVTLGPGAIVQKQSHL